MHSMNVKLTKIIEKSNEKIEDYNVLTINEGEEVRVNFENIESFASNIVCPKGSHYIYDTVDYNFLLNINHFTDDEKWDLKCYKHDTGYFLVFFLMKSHNNLFFANIENHPYDPQQLN